MVIEQINPDMFIGKICIIPLKEVQYVERHPQEAYKDAMHVILSGTTWNEETGCWNNAPYLTKEEGKQFLEMWQVYRMRIEKGD